MNNLLLLMNFHVHGVQRSITPRVINQPDDDVQVRFGVGVGSHKLGWKRLGSAPHCRGEQLSSLSVTCHPFIILRVIVIVIIVIIVSMENVK